MGDAARRILIALDGSRQSLDAARYAATMMRPGPGTIRLLHVFQSVPEDFWALGGEADWAPKIEEVRDWESQLREKRRSFLEAARVRLVEAGFSGHEVTVGLRDREASVLRGIEAEAASGFDALVIGRSGASGAGAPTPGSTALKLLEQFKGQGLWVVDGLPETHRVLIALDASDASLAAVDHVGRMVRASPCWITLLHVVRGISIPRDVMDKGFPFEYRQRLLEEAENAMKPTFLEARRRLVEAGIAPERVSSRHITGVSSRSGAILEEARNGGFGTIVLGRGGSSRNEPPSLGKVCREVCEGASSQAVWIAG